MFDWINKAKLNLPEPGKALPGRNQAIGTSSHHHVNGHPLQPPFADHYRSVVFGMGCFWGAERKYWNLPGVHVTAVGYAGGSTPNPTYEEVCSGQTGHTEVVLVVYDPSVITMETLLRTFWESHDPTQGMRQGNDKGTQYRSAIFYTDPELESEIKASADVYGKQLSLANYPSITTEIKALDTFFYAEAYHQQYLAKNPSGYCGLGGTGVCFSEG